MAVPFVGEQHLLYTHIAHKYTLGTPKHVCVCSIDNIDSVHRRQAAASQAPVSQRDTDTCTDAQESRREPRPNGKKMTAILVEGVTEPEVMDSPLKENRTRGLPPPNADVGHGMNGANLICI